MNVEIGTEARIFLFWEYLFQILGILSLQCAGNSLVSCYKTETKERRGTSLHGRSLYFSYHPKWRKFGTRLQTVVNEADLKKNSKFLTVYSV